MCFFQKSFDQSYGEENEVLVEIFLIQKEAICLIKNKK